MRRASAMLQLPVRAWLLPIATLPVAALLLRSGQADPRTIARDGAAGALFFGIWA